MYKLLQLPNFYELIKEDLQCPIILCGMTSFLMVLIIKILISFGVVSSHSIGPFEVGFILNLF